MMMNNATSMEFNAILSHLAFFQDPPFTSTTHEAAQKLAKTIDFFHRYPDHGKAADYQHLLAAKATLDHHHDSTIWQNSVKSTSIASSIEGMIHFLKS